MQVSLRFRAILSLFRQVRNRTPDSGTTKNLRFQLIELTEFLRRRIVEKTLKTKRTKEKSRVNWNFENTNDSKCQFLYHFMEQFCQKASDLWQALHKVEEPFLF